MGSSVGGSMSVGTGVGGGGLVFVGRGVKVGGGRRVFVGRGVMVGGGRGVCVGRRVMVGGGRGVEVEARGVRVRAGRFVFVGRGVRDGGRRVFVGRAVTVEVGRPRSFSVAVTKGPAVRGVNVLTTIGVMVPVRVASGVIVTCRVPAPETGMRAVPWGVPGPVVENGTTSSSGSEPNICAIATQTKMLRPSTINNASHNDRFSRSTFRKFMFTLTALLIGPSPGPLQRWLRG